MPTFPWLWVRLAFTSLLLVLLWQTADGDKIFGLLTQSHPVWFLGAVGLLILQTALSAWRWKIIAYRLGQRFSYPLALREYFLGQVINQAVPGAVTGDAARAVRMRRDVGLKTAGLAVALERFVGQIAMFAVLGLGFLATLIWPGGLAWPTPLANSVGMGLVAVVSVGVIAVLSHHFGGSTRLAGWFRPGLNALFSPKALPSQISLGAAIAVCNLFAFGLCAQSVGAPLPIMALFAVVPLVLFAMLVPLTISGWGVREGAAAVLLPVAGLSVAEAIATSALFGVSFLLATLPGLISAGMK